MPRAQLVNAQFDGGVGFAGPAGAGQSDFLPATFDNAAHVGLVAAQAGLTSAISLQSGGFDGHSQISNSYANSLPRLTTLMQYVWDKATQLGIESRLFMRVYSEFGRTPLNTGDGKDHYPIGTQVFMEANRRPGATACLAPADRATRRRASIPPPVRSIRRLARSSRRGMCTRQCAITSASTRPTRASS